MNPVIRVSVAVLATFGAGLVGYIFIANQVDGWYEALSKPPLTPPDWLFRIVWPILYLAISGAIAVVWLKDPQTEETESWVRFYFIQLLFNAAWPIFFFGFHAILIAFIDILFLIFIVITLIAGACLHTRWCAWLMAPYLAWILFAAYLNLGIWFLN